MSHITEFYKEDYEEENSENEDNRKQSEISILEDIKEQFPDYSSDEEKNINDNKFINKEEKIDKKTSSNHIKINSNNNILCQNNKVLNNHIKSISAFNLKKSNFIIENIISNKNFVIHIPNNATKTQAKPDIFYQLENKNKKNDFDSTLSTAEKSNKEEEKNKINNILIKLTENEFYKGDVDENFVRNGYGIYEYENKDIYEGEFYNGLRNGEGEYLYNDGIERKKREGLILEDVKNSNIFIKAIKNKITTNYSRM